MATGHAILSPSASHRWIHCPPSARLEARYDRRDTAFTLEGTLAHAYCARELKRWLGQPTDAEDAEIAQLADMYHTGEMDEHVASYVAIVKQTAVEANVTAAEWAGDARLLVETQLDLSEWIPGGFGTSDAIVVGDGTLEVIDFKYGKGVEVEARRNTQMMIYALGALGLLGSQYLVERVRMTIVQPRLHNIDTWELDVRELWDWGEDTLRPAAAMAWAGKGDREPGEWCKFCRCAATCQALEEFATEDIDENNMPSNWQMGSVILAKLETVKTWVKAVEEYALGQALLGTTIPGWKLVEGISRRKITDPVAVMGALRDAGLDDSEFMREPELRALTDIERNVGKARFAKLCGEWVKRPPGKPALVPESDKRPVWNSAKSDFDGIE